MTEMVTQHIIINYIYYQLSFYRRWRLFTQKPDLLHRGYLLHNYLISATLINPHSHKTFPTKTYKNSRQHTTKMPHKFSPSSLSLLKDCPRCFWLQFNKGIKRPDTIFPSLPSGMDRILKAYFDSFGEALPPVLKELKGVKLFNNKELLDIWRNNFKGIPWTDEEGNLFRGAVDCLLKKKNKLIVLDFKTRGYPVKEDTTEHYKDQLDIYNFLLRKNNYETEDYSYLLFYHPEKVNKKGDVVFNTDLIKMPVNIKNAEKIFREAVNILKKPMPKPSEDCGFCKWVDHCQKIV